MGKCISIFPESSLSNRYLEIQKSIHKSNGFKISPTPRSFASLIELLKVQRVNRIIVINWLEDISCSKGAGFFFLNFFWLVLVRFVYSKVIYVKHNLNPHSSKGIYYYKIMSYALNCMSDVKVAHRPFKGFNYVPHPTYSEKNDDFVLNGRRTIENLFLGQIKPYKGVLELITNWPDNMELLIVGECADFELDSQIREFVNNKSNINYINKFVSDYDYEYYLSQAKRVVLSHLANSMLVSGTFYHAASLGCNIIMNEGGFYDYCKSKFSFVTGMDSINLFSNESVPAYVVMEEIRNECGHGNVAAYWANLFDSSIC